MPEYLVIPNEYEERRLFKSYDLTSEQIKIDVAVVREWMSSQPHLPKFPESKNGKLLLITHYNERRVLKEVPWPRVTRPVIAIFFIFLAKRKKLMVLQWRFSFFFFFFNFFFFLFCKRFFLILVQQFFLDLNTHSGGSLNKSFFEIPYSFSKN